MFFNADDYYLKIAVAAKDSPTATITLKFKWTLDPATSEIVAVG
jgi:hypothetical protein